MGGPERRRLPPRRFQSARVPRHISDNRRNLRERENEGAGRNGHGPRFNAAAQTCQSQLFAYASRLGPRLHAIAIRIKSFRARVQQRASAAARLAAIVAVVSEPYFICAPISLNTTLILVPIFVKAAMRNTAIRLVMSAYSIAVAPESFRIKSIALYFMTDASLRRYDVLGTSLDKDGGGFCFKGRYFDATMMTLRGLY
jgi:hypothetical protein